MALCLTKRKVVAAASLLGIVLIFATVRRVSEDDGKPTSQPKTRKKQNEAGSAAPNEAPLSKKKDLSILDDDEGEASVLSPDGTRYIPRHRVVHLDLKGAPPKPAYLKSLFPLMREAGATALLVEYEDMFPYKGKLRDISARNSYTAKDVENLQKWAAENGMTVIPLVQTFGHMEHALKLAEFYGLREVPAYPQSLCPSKNASWHLVTQMIDQMVALHPASSWLHIGCDEVFQLGLCSDCIEMMMKFEADGELTDKVFLDHVHRVASYVRNEKGLVPIIWDDMLRKMSSEKLLESGIGKLVEPMVWVYVEEIDRFVYSYTWSVYAEVFPHMWAASAYKGAFGEQLYIANVARHAFNQVTWLEVMKREAVGQNKINFRGLVLTGWSRYDHFAVLCELLPAAVPSLVLNLAIVAKGAHDDEAAIKAHRVLKCPSSKPLMTQQDLIRNPEQLSASSCRFPGAQVLSLLSSYKNHHSIMKAAYQKVDEQEGWMTRYNVRHKFSSPWRVQQTMHSLGLGDYFVSSLNAFKMSFAKALSSVFDRYTVEEWMELHVDPLVQKVDDLTERARILSEGQVWPRRPLPSGVTETTKEVSAEEKH